MRIIKLITFAIWVLGVASAAWSAANPGFVVTVAPYGDDWSYAFSNPAGSGVSAFAWTLYWTDTPTHGGPGYLASDQTAADNNFYDGLYFVGTNPMIDSSNPKYGFPYSLPYQWYIDYSYLNHPSFTSTDQYGTPLNPIQAGGQQTYKVHYWGGAQPTLYMALFKQTGSTVVQQCFGVVGVPGPTVIDDGATSTNNIQLHATWSVGGGYTISEYQYAIGTSPTELVVNWKSAGTATDITETGLNLQVGTTYYWFVKAKSSTGDWSLPVSSDGITIARPSAPVVSDGAVYTTSPGTIHATWSASDTWGIAAYQYAVGTSPTNLVVDWKPAGSATQATETGVNMVEGQTYRWYVKARNAPGVWSDAGNSDGLLVAASRSVGAAKSLPNGTAVWLTNVRVTSKPTDMPGFWVEADNRSAAIMIPVIWTVNRGDVLTVAGILNWSDGVPSLISPEQESTPVAKTLWKAPMANERTVAGDVRQDLNYTSVTPFGLLMTAFGKVKSVDTTSYIFYMDDGSKLADGTGPSTNPNVGLRVRYKAGTTPPGLATFVAVTGIRTAVRTTLMAPAIVNRELRSPGEDIYVPLLVPRDGNDIWPLH